MELSKEVNETRSRMDVAQSELDIYLSQHKTLLTQLNQAKEAQQAASDTLKERRAAIKELEVKIPQCEEQLKKVCVYVCTCACVCLNKVSNSHRSNIKPFNNNIDYNIGGLPSLDWY